MKKEKKFSTDANNVEIVQSPEIKSLEKEIFKDKKNIVIGTLNVFLNPIKKRHEKHYKESKFHLAADVVLALIILFLSTALLFIYFNNFRSDIALNISADSKIIESGSSETFIIEYCNNNDFTLSKAALAVNFPKNFILESVAPADIFNSSSNTFYYGDLKSGANGKVKITGRVLGEVGGTEVLSASFNFVQKGLDKKVLSSLIFSIESSVLLASATVPERVYQSAPFKVEVFLKNSGSEKLENIGIALDKNYKIEAVESAKDVSQEENLVIIKSLSPGEEAGINIVAVTEQTEGRAELSIAVFINSAGEHLRQQLIKQYVDVYVPNLKSSITTNVKSIASEDAPQFKINFINKESDQIKNVKFAIRPASDNFSIDNIFLLNKDNEKSGDAILVGDLEAGVSGQIDFNVSFNINKREINQKIGVAVAVSYELNDNLVEYNTYSSAIKLLSDLEVSSRGLYYSSEGDQLGIGPVPPLVDIPTKYWIFLDINNFGNNIKGFSMSGDLPENVLWTGNKTASAGRLDYGKIGRRVIWTVGDIGQEDSGKKAGFEVSLIPGESDIGKVLDLIENIKFIATDDFCGKEMSQSFPNINTDLQGDKLAAGKGKVEALE
ncbi:MAG: hypothetical protein ABH881_01870 [bacterium]